ncbi:MAG: HAMP domain-containing histidine kinase [Ignavibacteria bacterium]|nr:HAMP domain-containing histidine kinase [Ignavibacteria bacterium]
MKLLAITNRYYIISILLFFVLAGVVLFFSIQYNLKEELDEQLRTGQSKVAKAMNLLDSVNSASLLLNDNLSVEKTSPSIYLKPLLFDSLLFDNVEKEYIPYRLIRFSAKTRTVNYIVTIKSSEIETTDIVYGIFISLMLVFGLFSVMLYVTNYYFSKKLWSPFLHTIAAIKTLNINNRDTQFGFGTTYIQEFNELNISLQQMIERIKSDYLRMKDFSENASHELQTPLTIIRTKLERLLQSKDLNADNAQLINQALENTSRLSRLNQALLMLTKIENRQFEQKQKLNFSMVFDKYIELYEEIAAEKELNVSINKDEDFIFEIHPVLSDILVSNLLGNAIKHNIPKGSITITIKKDYFEISNSGTSPEYPTDMLFTRFKKGNQSSEHLGLGLALVKEIADTNGLNVSYIFDNRQHIIKVTNTIK